MQVFGSANADLNHFVIDGNVIFNSGGAAGANYDARDSILIGGGSKLRGAVINGNQTYHSGQFGLVSFGFNAGGTDFDYSSNLTFDGVSILTATVNGGNNMNVNKIDSQSNVYVVGNSSIKNGSFTDRTLSLAKEPEWVVTRIPVLGWVAK